MSRDTSNTEPKVARVSFSSENDMKPLYYDKDGNRIADVSEPEPYKPMYDIEVKERHSGNYPDRKRNEFEVFFDVHTKIADFKSRTYWLGWLKALRKILLHKYIWRHFI